MKPANLLWLDDSINACARTFAVWIVLTGFYLLVIAPPPLRMTVHVAATEEAINAELARVADVDIDGITIVIDPGVIELHNGLTIPETRGYLTILGSGARASGVEVEVER